MTVRAVSFVLAMASGGCMTAQTYEGAPRISSEVARISGDYRVTAGAPLSVILRQVDQRALGFAESAVEVLPGTHQLLVDCRIAETGSVSRHAIEADVAAGRHYKLVAETAPGLRECTDVLLQAVD